MCKKLVIQQGPDKLTANFSFILCLEIPLQQHTFKERPYIVHTAKRDV